MCKIYKVIAKASLLVVLRDPRNLYFQWPADKIHLKRIAGVYELDTLLILHAQVAII